MEPPPPGDGLAPLQAAMTSSPVTAKVKVGRSRRVWWLNGFSSVQSRQRLASRGTHTLEAWEVALNRPLAMGETFVKDLVLNQRDLGGREVGSGSRKREDVDPVAQVVSRTAERLQPQLLVAGGL